MGKTQGVRDRSRPKPKKAASIGATPPASALDAAGIVSTFLGYEARVAGELTAATGADHRPDATGPAGSCLEIASVAGSTARVTGG